MRILLLIGCVFIVLSACSKRNLYYLHKKGVHVDKSYSITSHSQPLDTIKMQYLGCGGFYIRQNGQAIMIDPFFSHQSFMRIGRSIALGGKIRAKPKELEYGKRMIKDSLRLSDDQLRNEVRGIFSAHGHYDHLMDVPFIHHKWSGEWADVYVNSSSKITCANVISASRLHDIEKIASVRNQKGDSVEFSNGHSSIRVYPIFADHNPHSRNIKLFAGSAVKPPEHFKTYSEKTSVNNWLEGQTLSFVIDFVNGDSVSYRMFIQSSTCQFPNGIPPESLLKEKSIDLAILGVASYHFSENTYPCKFLQTLQPKELMFIHWEDFFRKLRQPTKAVKTNDVARFFTDVFSKCKMDYAMPLPGSVITITY